MVVNEPTAIARLGIDVNKISGFEMGCVESESPILRTVKDGVSPHRAIPQPLTIPGAPFAGFFPVRW
jgi:hypothetical protein